MSEVSIVLATYNGASYLEEQLDSVLANTFTDWTMEICDDGSNDRTLAIIEEYQEQYPGKFFLHRNEQNLGVTTNFLEGAKRAAGEYIMFCDQDDVWLPDKIEKTLKKLKEREAAIGKKTPIVVFTDAKLVDGVLRTISDSFFGYNGLDTSKTDLAHLLIENKVIGCTTMFNRAVADKIIRFPTMARYHDWWIALIGATFGEVFYLEEPTMLYRQHGNNVVGSQNFLQYVVDRIKNIKEQKQSLLEDERQAWEFYDIYKDMLLEEQAQILLDFSSMNHANWIEKRDRLFRYGFWKSGKLRNIGVFLLV